jgi:tetratricopeptide (TPR) repeat protein
LVRAAQAQTAEAAAAAVLAFLSEKVIAAGRPAGQDGGLGRDVKLIDAMRAALPFVKTSFAGQPLIEARVRMTLGRSFTYLGDHAAAEIEYGAARHLRAARLGPDHPDTLESMYWLAETYGNLDRHAEALKLSEEVLRVRRSRLVPHHPDTLEAMISVAFNYDSLGHHQMGFDLREEVLRVRRSRLGPNHPDTLQAAIYLAHSYRRLHRFQDAIALFEEALPREVSQVGPDDLDTLGNMFWLAIAYTEAGRHTAALKLHQEILDRREAKLGPKHPHTILSLWGLAESLIHLRRGDEAAAVIDDGLRRAGGNPAHRLAIKTFIFLDLRRLVARIGPGDRRAWSEDWMTPDPKDPTSLYHAACFRSLLAAVALADPKTPAADAPRLATAEADQAMDWLRQAVTAGYRNVVHMEKDTDLDALRGREDFQQLLASLRENQSNGQE